MIKFLLWNLENQDLSKLDHVRARRSLGVQSHPGVTIRRRASGSICSPRLGAQKYHRPSAENQASSRNEPGILKKHGDCCTAIFQTFGKTRAPGFGRLVLVCAFRERRAANSCKVII